MAIQHFKGGYSERKCILSVKYTSDFKGLRKKRMYNTLIFKIECMLK